MSVSRRRFLKHGALAVVACAAVPSQALSGRKNDLDGGADLNRGVRPHLRVSRSAFENLIGSSFKVTDKSGNSVWLRLIAVSELPEIAPMNVGLMSVAPKHSFSAPTTSGYILNLSAGGTSLTQDTYTFENASMGRFPMFIVPAGPGQYTALFNLLDAPVPLAPADDHAAPVHSGDPSSGASAGKAPEASSSAISGGAASSPSPSGRPAQEQLEPVFRRGVKTQMQE
jgi:hypothetical protein